MTHSTLLCFLLFSASLSDVTSFSVHRRHGRSTDLADALRMLERQRLLIENEGRLLSSSSDQGLARAGFEPSGGFSPSQKDANTAWLARTLGLDSYNGEGDLGESLSSPESVDFLPLEPSPDDVFGEEEENEEDPEAVEPPPLFPLTEKKDKEIMINTVGDVRPQVRTRDAMNAPEADKDDVRLTKEEFVALMDLVENLQKEAIEAQEEEEEEVAQEVAEKIAEERQEASEQLSREEEEEEESEGEGGEEEEEEEEMMTPDGQPLSEEDVEGLFEKESREVIPTDDGEIIKTEDVITDSSGIPVGRERTVEEVETLPGKDSLSSMADFWYVKRYLESDGNRRKRTYNPKPLPAAVLADLAPLDSMASPDWDDLLEAYMDKLNQLQSEVNQARLVAYLEDVENDILTDALNQATVAQLEGHVNPQELSSLKDAIKVEEVLQQVKTDGEKADDLSEDFAEEIAGEFGTDEVEEKRGDPWKRRSEVLLPEFIDDGDDVIDDEGNDSEEETTALALGDWTDRDEDKLGLDELFDTPTEGMGVDADSMVDDLIRESSVSGIASLFSDNADQCPSVQQFSTNCQFAGDSIDFEARALCNLHQMCYSCGATLEVTKDECDLIYSAASSMLCDDDRQCDDEAEIFLNTMKLKHRFIPYQQQVCRSTCTAQFLSII